MPATKVTRSTAPEPDQVVSRAWVQVTAVVLLFGLAILGFLGFRAYAADPPIPAQVRSTSGQVVFTGADVVAGQKLFLRKGLMEYGSIFGHGAYLGPDFTADYLHRAAQIVTREYGGDASGPARDQVISDFKTNLTRAPSRRAQRMPAPAPRSRRAGCARRRRARRAPPPE